jgi:hypothetical protein
LINIGLQDVPIITSQQEQQCTNTSPINGGMTPCRTSWTKSRSRPAPATRMADRPGLQRSTKGTTCNRADSATAPSQTTPRTARPPQCC